MFFFHHSPWGPWDPHSWTLHLYSSLPYHCAVSLPANRVFSCLLSIYTVARVILGLPRSTFTSVVLRPCLCPIPWYRAFYTFSFTLSFHGAVSVLLPSRVVVSLACAEVKNKLFAMVPNLRINSWESCFIFNLQKINIDQYCKSTLRIWNNRNQSWTTCYKQLMTISLYGIIV
jgi:hypothetical protein